MERVVKEGKDLELTLKSVLEENSLTLDEVVYSYIKAKKGLFKGEVFEVSLYKKSDLLELSKSFLKELISNLGLDVNFESKVKEDRQYVVMYSSNNNVLIGHEGNTLRALENILRQKIFVETGVRYSIYLDVENYKDKKNLRIERLAKQLAREVVKTKIPVKMDNMNAYERRIVHNALSKNSKVVTKSEGVDPNRHVVIDLAKE